MKLNNIYEQAQMMSKCIDAFTQKQQYKFSHFAYIPQEENEILDSVIQLETDHLIVVRDIILDLQLNIPPLVILDYADYLQELAQTNSENDFLNKLMPYHQWLIQNKITST